MTVRRYIVLAAANGRVNGKDAPTDSFVDLTDAAARYERDIGHIRLQGTAPAPALPPNVLPTDVLFGLRDGLGHNLTIAELGVYFGLLAAPGGSSVPAASNLPAVSGVARVGELFTGTPATWFPVPLSHAYQWFADGVAIEGATGLTYLSTEDDLGVALAFGDTASGFAGAGLLVKSAATSPLAAAVLGGLDFSAPLGTEHIPLL